MSRDSCEERLQRNQPRWRMRVNGIHSQKSSQRGPGTSPGVYTHWKRECFGLISKTEVFTSINIVRHVMQNLEVCAFYISSLTTYCQFLFHLILKSCTSLGSSALWKLGSQRNVFSSNHGTAPQLYTINTAVYRVSLVWVTAPETRLRKQAWSLFLGSSQLCWGEKATSGLKNSR